MVLLNLVASKFYFRLDLSEDQRYTLSNATKNILEELGEPVTITAYFGESLPPRYTNLRDDLHDLIVEYASRSDGMVQYEFLDPTQDEEIKAQAEAAGVAPVQINIREKDKMEAVLTYMGLIIKMGEGLEVIPLLNEGTPLEYILSTSIKKLSVVEKPVIGLLQGHGEPSQYAMQQAMADLSILYNIEPITLSESAGIPDHIATLAIVDPVDSFPLQQLLQLDAHLAKGNGIFISMSRVSGDLSQDQYGKVVNTGLESWLANKGINVGDEFIIDASCSQIQVRRQMGQFSMMTPVSFHYWPLISDMADHPVSKGMEALVLKFASTVEFTGDTNISYTPLAFSSEKSGLLPAPVVFDIQKRWTENDFPYASLPVAAAFDGTLSGTINSRMVVVANGDLAVSGEGQQAQQLPPDNVNLMVNGIDWISDATGLIELRNKGIMYRGLDEVDEGKRSMLKWINLLLPILVVIIYGFMRAQWRRKQRNKRKAESYVQ